MSAVDDPKLPDTDTDTDARAPVAGPSSRLPQEGIVELVDAGRTGGARVYLPNRPWLARDGCDRPVLSLTVVLSRRPGPDERDILPLMERGQLSFDTTLAVPAGALAATSVAAMPAFTRSATFLLVALDTGIEIARATAAGPSARAALTASLNAAQTRAVIEALGGHESRMRLSAVVVVDRAPMTARVSLRASWAALYDGIALAVGDAPDFDAAVLERALQQLITAGTMAIEIAPPGLAPAEVMSVAIRGLLRSGGMIFTRVRGAGSGRYRLTERPAPEFQWRYDERLAVPVAQERSISAPLEQVLGRALDGRDWSEFVRLIAPDGGEAGYWAVPRLCRGEVERADREPDGVSASSMVMVNATLQDASALTATARPVVRPVPMRSGDVRQVWLADGLLDYLGTNAARNLPVTSDGSEILFPDRLDGTRRWYVPALEIVAPDPASEPESASFLFSFERIGTASSGDAALGGIVRVTLRPTVPEEVRTALTAVGNPPAQPVAMLDVSVELSVPFVDSADNSRNRTTLRGTIEHAGGEIVATFAIADRWVRLVYGVLASPGFQGDEQASLRYSFRYECYRVVKGSTVKPLNGIKQALIPVDWSAHGTKAGLLVFDAKAGVLAAGATHIRFVPEADDVVASGRAPQERGGAAMAVARPVAITAAQPLAGVRPEAARARPIAEVVQKPLPVMIRPAIIDVRPPLREHEYVQQSVGVQGAADVLMPCNLFGTLYRQKLDTGWKSIGCQDAFRLGTAPHRLFEEIGALANTWFRVYRCLPQPGRFLLLPRTYRIARYPPTHERAYLPAAMVYAVLDPASVANNRYRFVTTVEPDIPQYEVRALRAALVAYASAATIEFNLPTEVATQTDLPTIPLASALTPPRFTVTGKGVQVVLECAIADALVLRSAIEKGGVLGRLAFSFEDSSRLESDLEIALGQIGGPWGAGPVSAERRTGEVALTNRIERALDVSLLRLYVATAAATEVAVSAHLEPGASAVIAAADRDAEIAVVYSVAAAGPRTLEECRVYMEDVSTNVIFTCGINYAARGIRDVEVYARLGVTGDGQRVLLSEAMPRIGTVEFTAPLSSVVGSSASSPAIEYRLVRVTTAGDRVERPWALCPGALVDIQWDLVA